MSNLAGESNQGPWQLVQAWALELLQHRLHRDRAEVISGYVIGSIPSPEKAVHVLCENRIPQSHGRD